MEQPTISFVIAAYNAVDFVEEAIQSALLQSGVSVEVIVIDDGSRDDTANRIHQAFSADNRVRLISQKNQGASAARNRGLKAARGVWIAVLDADDRVKPERSIELITLALKSDSDLVCDDVMRFLDYDHEIRWPLLNLPRAEPFQVSISEYFYRNLMFRGDDNLGYLKTVYRRDFLLKHLIEYDERLRIGEDFDLCLKCLIQGANYVITPRAFYEYRVTSNSLSSGLRLDDLYNLIRAYDEIMIRSGDLLKQSEKDAGAKYRHSLVKSVEFIEFKSTLINKEWANLVRYTANLRVIETIGLIIVGKLKRALAKRKMIRR